MIQEIILHGELRGELVSFNAYVAEVTIFGDFTYNRQRFINLPVVRIVIEEIDYEDVCADVIFDDEYCRVIPYLKAKKHFRDLLEQELLALKEKTGGFHRRGIEEYLKRLKTYSEIKTIISEVKSAVNRLKPEKADSKVLRQILTLLGRSSETDNTFAVRKEA
ncbi:MAG: hypothetical protein RBS77_00015 [Candidatus Moranbacteria bacterium]|jgi:hypothetical protein|nr:hypothetical protein [Candidatus Moranbacteria bacterium]